MARKTLEKVAREPVKNLSAFNRESYKLKRVWQENHEIKYDFVLTELDLALTLFRIASSSPDLAKAERNRRHANTARQTAMRFLEQVPLTEQREATLRQKLLELDSLYPLAR